MYLPHCGPAVGQQSADHHSGQRAGEGLRGPQERVVLPGNLEAGWEACREGDRLEVKATVSTGGTKDLWESPEGADIQGPRLESARK